MEANVATKKQNLKSAEQRMLEQAADEFAEKCRAIFRVPVKVEIKLTGVPLSKIAHIAEFIRDEDGERCVVRTRESFSRGTIHYIDPSIDTATYEIESISE